MCSDCDGVCLSVITESRSSHECVPLSEECPELEGLCSSEDASVAISEECAASYEEQCGNRIFSENGTCLSVSDEEDSSLIPSLDCYY